ncbi:hypothetical protein FisN_21Hh054 [Fistulifera solaris]|uniref:Uncharacterized protein n=1 Tax=Fistulifera solaris TaxID=1519565 RepID=A0A1Z5KAY7_FISSO|nr:hypothetical protein FisN_21Hh054 [Fistulifera solaris]|eukprot:GAX23261.1 hypothetical protein FisN_21Hh054 [Fistulifera solaris]
MRALEDIPSHTPVLTRKQWLQNAFKPTEKNRAPAPGHDLVHSRLSWLEEQKRNSRLTMSPNNKDAASIPEHLVEDRKKWLDEELRRMLKRTEGNRRHSFPARRFASMGNLTSIDARCNSDFSVAQSYSYDMFDKNQGDYMVGMKYAMPCSTTSTDTDMTSSNYSSNFQEYKGFMQESNDLSMEAAVPLYYDDDVSNDLQRYITDVSENLDYKIINIGHLEDQKSSVTNHVTVRKQVPARSTLNDIVSPTSSLADYARHSAHTFTQTQFGVGPQDEELVLHSSHDYPLRTPPRKTQRPIDKTSRTKDQKAARSKKVVMQKPVEARCTCAIM